MDLLELIEAKKGEPPQGVPSDVALLFEKIALELVDEGFKRFSADAVMHQLRWRTRLEWKGRAFKANNNDVATLSRWFLNRHPHLKEIKFFELRERRQEVA